jgi:hypothetical protein
MNQNGLNYKEKFTFVLVRRDLQAFPSQEFKRKDINSVSKVLRASFSAFFESGDWAIHTAA